MNFYNAAQQWFDGTEDDLKHALPLSWQTFVVIKTASVKMHRAYKPIARHAKATDKKAPLETGYNVLLWELADDVSEEYEPAKQDQSSTPNSNESNDAPADEVTAPSDKDDEVSQTSA